MKLPNTGFFKPHYWRCDLKWVFGIIFSLSLIILLSLNVYYKVSSPEVTKKLYNTIVGQMVEDQNLEKEYPQMLARTKSNPKGEVGNFLGIKFTGKDIKGKSFEEFKDLIATTAYKAYYEQSKVPTDSNFGLLSNFNLKSYNATGEMISIFNIFTPLACILMLIFAFGFDKLVAFGEFTVISTAMLVLIYNQFIGEFTKKKDVIGIAFQVITADLDSLMARYNYLMYFGLFCIVGGFGGRLVYKYFVKNKEKERDNTPSKE